VVDVSVKAPNSLVLIGDPTGDVPETLGGGLVRATGKAVAVGTRAEVAGETRIRVIDAGSPEHRPPIRAFEGMLEAPSGRLTIESVDGETYGEHPIPRGETRVEIWVNDDREPDEICVVLG